MSATLAVLRNRNMALLLSGRIVSATGDWIYQVALTIAIYQYSGGKSYYVGLFWLIRLIPNLVLSSFAGRLADRLGPRRAMIAADLGRLVLVVLLALLFGRSTWAVIYPIAFGVNSLSALFNPAGIALIPRLVATADERLAANATVAQVYSLAVIAGSLVGGLATGLGIRTLLFVDAGTFVVSALMLTLIRLAPRPAPKRQAPEAETAEEGGGFLASYRMLTRRPVLLFAAGVMALPELASGAYIVWFAPYSERWLHLGSAGVGYLYMAVGAGTVLGGFVAARLGSNIRLDYLLAGSALSVGVALALFGAIPLAISALLFILILALAEEVEYAAYETLLQQAVPEDMIGRAYGTMSSYLFNMMLIGNVLSGLLATWPGLQISIVGLGVLTVIVTGVAWWVLRLRTAGQPTAAALARIPAFARVTPEVREWAVRRMAREQYPAGAVVIRQGEEGDTFYTIAQGTAEVEVSANGHTRTRTLEPGDFFGEIALLEHVPRTATVRAETPLTVWTLSREDFEDLQERAAEFKQSLLEIANARLEESTNYKLALGGA